MAEHFYSIYDWMTDDLELTGREMNIFALIYSFTEAGRDYDGGLAYLAKRTGTCRQHACVVLKQLQEKGLIAKKERFEGGLKCCAYRAAYRRAPQERPSAVQETGTEPFGKTDASVRKTGTEPFGKTDAPVRKTGTYYKEYHKEDHKEDHKEVMREDARARAAAGAGKPSPSPKNSFGEYGNVRLTEAELDKLKTEFPEDWRQRIERLSAYMASTGKAYKNHLATIRNWAMRDTQDKRAQEKPRPAPIPGGLHY